jgi:phosphoenolpyruvate synthase/pyruvate phosphate dikinase
MIEHYRQHGRIVNCGMGVVVQTMIDAEAAGVMFTRHPMTGDPSCILITSNYGLGESVVSGTVEPDTIYIEKDLKNHIKVKNIDIGSKTHKMSLDKMNNNVESRVQKMELTVESKKASLSNDDCIKLGNIAISQEALWGSPRDIEWAVSKVSRKKL